MLVLYKADFIIISMKINFFSPWYSWKIVELALNNHLLFITMPMIILQIWLISLYLLHFTNMIYLPLFISFFKYDLSPFIYYILQIWFISPYVLHFTLIIPIPLLQYIWFISLYLFKEYLKLLNRLYDITWFGSVYA